MNNTILQRIQDDLHVIKQLHCIIDFISDAFLLNLEPILKERNLHKNLPLTSFNLPFNVSISLSFATNLQWNNHL